MGWVPVGRGSADVQGKSGARFEDLKDMLQASTEKTDPVFIHGLSKDGAVLSTGHLGRIVMMAISALDVARHQSLEGKIQFSELYPQNDTGNWQTGQYMCGQSMIYQYKMAAECKRGSGFVLHQTLWEERTLCPIKPLAFPNVRLGEGIC